MAFTFSGTKSALFQGGISVAPEVHKVILWGAWRPSLKEAPFRGGIPPNLNTISFIKFEQIALVVFNEVHCG